MLVASRTWPATHTNHNILLLFISMHSFKHAKLYTYTFNISVIGGTLYDAIWQLNAALET